MRRILVATDLSEGAHEALGRAVAMAAEQDAELRIVNAWPHATNQDECLVARANLRREVAAFPGAPDPLELDLSIRMPWKEPVEAILREAARFNPDLIILGAHGSPRLRDVLFGTTATRVARDANQPVLIVQNDHRRPYRKLLAAIDDRSGKEVLKLALAIFSVKDLHVIHACGSVGERLFGGGDTIEKVRSDQEVMTQEVAELVGSSRLGSVCPRIHNIVEEGDAVDIIMKALRKVQPDLLVMGTEGRAGLARLLHGSHAESAILGCTSDILVARTPRHG